MGEKKQMIKAVAVTAREKAELVEIPADGRPLGGDEVTGRTLVSFISPGTELGGNYLGETFPSYPGYCGVFEVGAVGADVKDLAPGARVFVTGPAGAGGHRAVQRCPRAACIPLPAGLAPEAAVHARLMGVSMSTLTTTTARPPDRVLVVGLGPVGHLAAQLFQACGYRVTGVECIEQRRQLALDKGVRDVRAEVPARSTEDLQNYSLALECSGHEAAAVAACGAVRKRGEVVIVGVPRQRRTELYAFDLLEKVFRGYVTLRSGWEWEVARHGAEFRVGSVFGNLAAALQWLAEGRVRVDGLYAVASPADAQQAYQDLLHRRTEKLSVVFDWTRV